MKRKLFLFLLIALFAGAHIAYSQKTISFNVTQLRLSGLSTGCDGIGPEDPRWYFTNNQNGNDWCVEKSSSSSGNQTWTENTSIFSSTYICASDVPATVDVRMRACENDGGSCWTLSSCDGGQHDHTVGVSTSTTNGTYNSGTGLGATFYTDDHGGCGNADYGYTLQMLVSGSWQTTKNQDNSGYLTNTTCATSSSFSFPGSAGWSTKVNQHIIRCAGSVWYTFTLGTNVDYFEIDVFNGDADDVKVFRQCGGCEVSNEAGAFDYDFLTNNPVPGVYYVQVIDNDDDYFSLDIRYGSTVTRPANDMICNATNISSGVGLNYNSGFISSNNINASDEDLCGNDEPQENDNRTVWYKFTTGSTIGSELSILVENAGGDNMTPDIAVFKGPSSISCATLYSFATLSLQGEDDGTYLTDGDAEVVLSQCDNTYSANTIYYVQIDDEGGGIAGYNDGDFRIRVQDNGYTEGPDNICNASSIGTINGLTGTLSKDNQSNFCATTQSGEFSGGQNTVWYTFTTGATVAYDFNINMDAETNGLNSDITVYQICGNACTGSSPNWSNLTEIDNFYDVNPLPGEFDAGGTISGRIKPNSTYYVRADGTSTVGTTGGFDIDMSFSGGAYAANDNICNSASIGTLVPGNSSISNGTIDKSSSEDVCVLDEPNQANDETTVWYKYNVGAAIPSFLSFDVDFGFGCTPDLNIYTGPATLTGCPFVTSSNSFSQLTFVANGGIDAFYEIECVSANTTYYLQVDEDGLCSGSFTLEVIAGPPPPSNDLPCNAINVPSQGQNTYATSNFSGTNIDGTNCNEPDPGWTLNANEAGVWYKLNAPGRNLIIDANSNSSDNIDIKLALYEGPCGNAALMNPHYIDRDYDAGSFDEDMYFNCLDPLKDYYLIVDGSFLNGEGNFDIEVYYPYEGGRTTCTSGTNPARNIGTVPNGGSVSYVNTSNFCGLNAADLTSSGGGASVPAPPFTVDKAVWYKFRPPASGSVKINANSDPVIGAALGFGSGDELNLEMVVYESSDGSCAPAIWTVTDYASYSNGLLAYDEELIVNCLDPSKDYWLLVDGEFDASLLTGGIEGYFEIYMEDYGISTANDLACDAIPFTTNPTQLNNWNACNTNVTITLNDQNNYCGNNLNEPSPSNWTPLPATAQPVWYSFVAPPSGKLEIRLNTTTSLPWRQDYLNGKLAVYDLPDGQNICSYVFTSADEVVSDYDLDIPPASTGEDIQVECLIPGRTYYLMVDGKETALYPEWYRGEFSLEFESDPRDAPAPNDSICQAKALGDPTGGSVGSDVNDASLINSPARNPNDPSYCMRAENSFCAGTADDPALNGFTLWGFDNTVWYTFIGPASGAVRIEVDGNLGIDGDEFAPQVVVYESSDGTCLGNLYDLNATPTISSGFSTSASMDVNCLNTGQVYFIAVDGGPLALELGDINGYFEIEVTEITPTEFPPSNNDICDAKIINPFAGLVSISNDTNRCANREFTIPEPSTFTRDHTVWYSFTTPNGAGPYAVEIDVNSQLGWPFGDAVDPQIAVYRSSNNTCSGSIIEHFSDYSAAGLPLSENAEVHCLDPNTTYWIMVDGSAINSQGYFDITVQSITPNPVAVNNDICDLVNLGTLGATNGNTLGGTGTDYNNFCADVQLGEVVPDAFGLDQTVWFSFITPTLASASDGVNVDFEVLNDPNALGDQIDLQFALYQSSDGTCTGTLTEIESAYNPLGFSETMNDICLKQNTRYFIQVDGGINTQGYFTIEITNDGVSARPVNDDFCNAQNLTLGTASAGNNGCATIESGEPNAGLGVQKSVWYRFVAPASGRVEIRTSDQDGLLFGIDPEWRLYKFDGACAAGLFTGTFLELANDYTPLLDDVENYECLFPGQTYYVQVDGTTLGGDEGDFEITVTDLEPSYGTLAGPPNASDPEPDNNACDNATTLTVNSESCQYSTGTWDDENYGKPTRSMDEISCGSNCGEIWYKFTMPSSGFVKIEGNDDLGLLGINNSELVIAAYTGTCGSLTLMECGIGGFNQDVDYSISAAPGATIYLQVFDDNGDAINEDFQLCVSARCAADDCEDVLSIAQNILNEGAQCFDVSDATGENISGGDAGYGVGGVYSDNPGNSVYYTFTTDNFCAGYELTITTPDVGNVGGLGGAELIMSIYEDDGSPCNHNILSEPLLDIQTFDKATYPAGINYMLTYSIGTGVNNIKPNTRYIIQIEGNSSTADGTIEVKQLCDGRAWAYPTAPLTSSNGYCYDGTWRHYYNDAGTALDPSDDILIFSVKSNGNVFDGIAKIKLDAAPGFAENPAVEASWTMRRHWDFEITSGSIVNPVDVKFYYLDAEKQEIITLAQNYASNYGLNYEAFEWFKSKNGVSFNPTAHVTPPIVLAGYGSGSGPNITGDVIVNRTGVGVTIACEDHDADASNEFCNGVQYVEYLGLTGFSGGTGATGAGPGGSPLPVELLYFTGNIEELGNVLRWATATEINNDFFEIQHSLDGVVFEKIATIDGAGNSNTSLNYSYLHKEFTEGYNYYRLKNVDFDGSYELSSILVLDNRKREGEESLILLLYPNPTTRNEINLEAFIAEAGSFRIDIYDNIGKVVASKFVSLNYGKNTVKIDLNNIAAGAYTFEMIDLKNNEKLKKKFLRTE